MMLSQPQPFRPARTDWLQAGLVAVALFALYAATSPRTVALEDDGLFILASYFQGVAHPPGYPLYTLLGYLFSQLPFGSPAYRVHLLSAMFGSLTCATLWLCARALVAGRLPAYLTAFGLGLSPVFWSQSLIAEVYTFNTFFFSVLVLLGLRACPPDGDAAPATRDTRVLPWMALLFGLSLSNHYPLMLLVAPAFAILLWPLRDQLLRRLPLLAVLVVLGLVPYAWMIIRSWVALPISFYGPLEHPLEIWYFLSRAGYAHVDESPSANWLDRLQFIRFVGAELLLQFAVLGTLLAASGFAVQWRTSGRRVAAFFTLAFLMPSVGLALLLGFDYDAQSKHVFHVYPLPAYAVAAIWMGLGFAWLAQRLRIPLRHAVAGCVALLAVIFAVASRSNLLANYDFAARYAHTVLRTLPQDAVLFVKGDVDLAPIAYFVGIENWRPDITLYHSKGLIIGNRLFHPLRIDTDGAASVLRKFIEEQSSPIAFTLEAYGGYARRDRWLFVEVDKSSLDPRQVTVDIPEEAIRFFEESILSSGETNAWAAFHQNEMRRRYGALLARVLPRGQPPDARTARHLAALSEDFFGAIGIAEGLMSNQQGYSVGAVAAFLDRARQRMPSDIGKAHLTGFFHLSGLLRIDQGDKHGAARDLETAVSILPTPDNRALAPLRELYRAAGNEAALQALEARIKPPAR